MSGWFRWTSDGEQEESIPDEFADACDVGSFEDQAMEAGVRAILRYLAGERPVTLGASIRDGKVLLTGEAQSVAELDRAVELIGQVHGVRSVECRHVEHPEYVPTKG